MHRAKHRAAGRASGEVLATTLLERYAVVPGPRHEGSGPRHGVVTMSDVASDAGTSLDRAAPLFGGAPEGGAHDGWPFRAARHAQSRATVGIPAPRVPAPLPHTPTLSGLRVRPQPVGAALSVLGAAAAVTAVVVPPPAGVETTGSLAPVQNVVPAPVPPMGPVLAAPAAAALPDQPTVQIADLVSGVTAQMQKAEPAAPTYTTVANKTELSSPAAMRKAAMSNAMAKLGKPYRWGAVGPNAFDCSGLTQYAWARAGVSIPRVSRAQFAAGRRVARSALRPGDLVFFGSPVYHVAMYVGGGLMIAAPQPGDVVKVQPLRVFRDYVGATRPG